METILLIKAAAVWMPMPGMVRIFIWGPSGNCLSAFSISFSICWLCPISFKISRTFSVINSSAIGPELEAVDVFAASCNFAAIFFGMRGIFFNEALCALAILSAVGYFCSRQSTHWAERLVTKTASSGNAFASNAWSWFVSLVCCLAQDSSNATHSRNRSNSTGLAGDSGGLSITANLAHAMLSVGSAF